MDEFRRRPEDLLKVIDRAEATDSRGKLRVFLGMCPGVGKTYAMLKAGKDQLARGVRVQVGLVETHGRRETESVLAGFEVLPRKQLQYKGRILEEMDLDLILKEKPELVLVDELAHTNAPGSRHSKRYHDVEEILAAGIDVYTTLNIQHIESRNDQVAQITGVQVRETVPDLFLQNATQMEVIDLSPRELLQRLSEGKVYLGDRAEVAASNFFKEEQLSALRELALRFTAEKVDRDLHDQMVIRGVEGPWNTNERLLVAVSHSPYAVRLVRATRRMAYNLEAPWIAVHVNTGEVLSPEDQKTLQSNLALARDLGAEVITLTDMDVLSALNKICAEKNVTQIVMGRPDRRFFRDLLDRGTLLDRLVRNSSKIDVHVIRAERKPQYKGFSLRLPFFNSKPLSYYNTFCFVVGVSFLSYFLLPYLGYQAMGSIFLLAILAVSTVAGRGPILFAALLFGFVWNFLFIPPVFTFQISSSEDTAMLLSYFVAAGIAGFLTSRIRKQDQILREREERTRILFDLSQSLSAAESLIEIQSATAASVDRSFGGQSSLVFINRESELDLSQAFGKGLDQNEVALIQWVFSHGKPAGWSTQTLSASRCLALPLKGSSGVLGVFAYFPHKGDSFLGLESENFLNAILSQAAVSFERWSFAKGAEMTKLLEVSETLHQTLLNSVSHELRTPITALIGSATALSDAKTVQNIEAREALTEDLVQNAKRLDRVVENLLDLSRLQKEGLHLKLEWFEIGECIQAMQYELKNELEGRRFKVVGNLDTVIEADFQLLLHALQQIVLNACKYTEAGGEICLKVVRGPKDLEIHVLDEGKGIPDGLEEDLFTKFFRVPGTPAGGLGLGLTIARDIVKLHGGRIRAGNRHDRTGADFHLSLPLKDMPPELEEVLR